MIWSSTVSRKADVAGGRGLEAEAHEVVHEGLTQPLVHTLQEARQRRPGGVVADELLVVDELATKLDQPIDGKVQQRPALQRRGIEPVGEPGAVDGAAAQLGDEPRDVANGLVGRRRLDDDHDVVQLAEVPKILAVARGVGRRRRQELEVRALERQRPERPGQAEHRERQPEGRRHRGAGDRGADERREPASRHPVRVPARDQPTSRVGGWSLVVVAGLTP